MLIILMLACIIVGLMTTHTYRRKSDMPTAAGSILMVGGIFIQGAWGELTGLSVYSYATSALVILLIAIWIYLLLGYITSIRKDEFYAIHLADPVGRFAIGTWIAGTSILLITIYTSFPSSWVYETVLILAVMTIGLWIFFMYWVVKSMIDIAKMQAGRHVHGIVLLATVATQSIAMLLYDIFGHSEAMLIICRLLIGWGLVLYVVLASLMIYRYVRYAWNTADQSQSNNVMMYGALAITGVAVIETSSWTPSSVSILWWISLAVLLVVECIEMIRAVMRIRRNGWKTAVGTYDVTQWSRIFTIGIFNLFTWRLISMNSSSIMNASLANLQMSVMIVTAGMMVILLIWQCVLSFDAFLHRPVVAEVPVQRIPHVHSRKMK